MRKKVKKIVKLGLLFIAFLFSFESILAVDQHNFIVVVDAGHGGRDPGAVSGKNYEKDVTLKIALALGDMIQKNKPNVKVIYTRDKDVYLTLQERANIANKSKADLFISIHVNANKKESAFGTETYTLGLTKSKSNLDVAMRENSVILLEDDYKVNYAGFDPNSADSYIMFECIQDRYLDKSVQFASEVQQSFSEGGRKNRGVRQAGFWVLHKTAMPSVLVEVGFISNKEERKFLMSNAGQQKMAKAIFGSFDDFVNEYEKKSGNQNYVSVAESSKSTEKAPVKDVVKKQVVKKEKVVVEEKVAVMSEEEDKQTQQFLDKMKAESGAKEVEIKNEIPVEKLSSKPTEEKIEKSMPKVEPIVEAIIPSETQNNTVSSSSDAVFFKLQLFALSKKKPFSDPVFKGLKLDYYIEGGLYKYTYGKTKSFEKIKSMKKQIASKFPSIIIAFKNGERVPLDQVLKK